MNIKRVASAGMKAASLKRIANPWQISADDFPDGGSYEEQLWFAVSYAVLAPSTHNTQPWQFVIQGRELDLHADYSRALPVVDPQGRELIISCGAALFYLRLALRYFGYSPVVDLLPDPGSPGWLARVHLGTKSEVQSDTVLLFQAIPHRHTNRLPFWDQPVPGDLLDELESAVQMEGAWLRLLESDEDRAAVAKLVGEGDRRQWADKHFRKELAAWVRSAGSNSHDGLPIGTQDLGNLLSHAGPFAIRTLDLGKRHAAKDEDIVLHSPALAVIGTGSDDISAWMDAGQALARLLLRAQGENISASFLSQPVEVAELRPCLADIAAHEGFPQLLLRLGYGDPMPHTPRRAVADVVTVHTSSHSR
jgi:hypothetical protein